MQIDRLCGGGAGGGGETGSAETGSVRPVRSLPYNASYHSLNSDFLKIVRNTYVSR